MKSKPLALLLVSGCAGRPETAATAPEVLEVVADAGFTGDAIVLRNASSIEVIREGPNDAVWPWASVTKQVVAVMILQQVEAGRLSLDASSAAFVESLDGGPRAPSIRELLQHRSGLRNPDDTPLGPDGVPSFYGGGTTGLSWCTADRGAPPPEGWSYNNCDYIVLGQVLEAVTGKSLDVLLRTQIVDRAGLGTVRFSDEEPVLARYGASGGLVGSLRDMLRFDAALMDGRLLGAEARATLWDGEPTLGYMALGQWSFEAPLSGCTTPVWIVERRGQIGRVQVRNFIAPERGLALALATDQAGFDFGEIWAGSGTSHRMLSAVVCPDSGAGRD